MSTQPRLASRLDAWLASALLFAGTLVFIGAGRQHPRINASLGVPGSDEFYRNFAGHMLHNPDWQGMHLLILLGPVLWALAAATVARLVSPRAVVLADLGRDALLLGASLWVVAFVLDGYVGPRYAAAIASAGPSADAAAIRAFSMNAFFMARLGMFSVVLLGIGTFTLAGGLLVDARLRSWRAVVGALGFVVGGWPIVAALRGEFWPGPFTSSYWRVTALSFGLWFLLLGTALPLISRRQATAAS